MSRVSKAQKNILYGIVNKLINMIIGLAFRAVIIYTLGAEVLGLNGVFTSLLTVLSIAELGIGTAIMYSLYKPIAHEDKGKLLSLLSIMHRTNRYIALIICVLGLMLLPFLEYLVNFEDGIEINYKYIYILFLVKSVISYLFGAYTSVLITADQKEYIITRINGIISIISTILQCIFLIIIKNYYMVIMIQIFAQILINLLVAKNAFRMYPFLKNRCITSLDEGERKSILKNVYALSLTRISSIIYTSSDNIVISTILGTKMVGYYSNYLYMTLILSGFIGIIFNSLIPSIGNLRVTSDSQQNHVIFKRMLFINMWIYGIASICIYFLATPFLFLCFGEEYIFNHDIVFWIVLMFLVPGLNHTCMAYRAACGLFWKTRYRTVATAGINILLSIVLAKLIGLAGVFIGTIVAFVLTIYLVDPRIIYKEVLCRSSKEYYLWLIKSFMSIIIASIPTKILINQIELTNWFGFLLSACVCLIIPNMVFIIINIKKEEFNYYLGAIKKLKL